MSELQRTESLCYLATVYSKHKEGLDAAYIDAARIAAKLLVAGIKVYSPIAHTHPLAVYGGLDPLDHAIWLPFDEAMMNAADILIVAQMDGWEVSKGIAHEIKFFETRGKPIYDLDPATMVMAKRVSVKPPRHRMDGASDEELERERRAFLENKPLADSDIERARARIAELDKQIAEYPRWGAALSAMDSERRGLLRRFGAKLAHNKDRSNHAGTSE